MALKARVEKNKEEGKQTLVTTMHDKVAIEQHVEFIDGKFSGHVDLGTGEFDDCAPMATDAVSVNEHFKIPLGYFLIKGMSGEERAALVTEFWTRLHETGVMTIAHVCDGPSCHMTMLRILGATVTVPDLQPSVPHPVDKDAKIRILLDVCHMLKL